MRQALKGTPYGDLFERLVGFARSDHDFVALNGLTEGMRNLGRAIDLCPSFYQIGGNFYCMPDLPFPEDRKGNYRAIFSIRKSVTLHKTNQFTTTYLIKHHQQVAICSVCCKQVLISLTPTWDASEKGQHAE